MGRSHGIWNNFDVVLDKKDPDVKCKKCRTVILSARPSRNLIKHAVYHCTDEEKKKWKKFEDAANAKKIYNLGRGKYTPRKSTPSPISPTGDLPTPSRRLEFDPASPSAQPTREVSKPVRLDLLTKEEHDAIIAEGFYATGISFRCVENPTFQRMFAQKLPSRKELATALLDATYARHRARVIDSLKRYPHFGLVSDGWSNVNNDSVVNFVLARPDMKPVFWTSIVTEDKSHTGEYIAGLIGSVISEIEAEFGENVIASVVTDNASNMQCAWDWLRRDRPKLFCHGCSAHGMDLLVKDMFKSKELKSVLDNCKLAAKFVKQHHAMWARFKRFLERHRDEEHPHARRPSLPVSTRWYSNEYCISRVISNRDVYMMTFSDPALLDKYRRPKKKQAGNQSSTNSSQQQPTISPTTAASLHESLAPVQHAQRIVGNATALHTTQFSLPPLRLMQPFQESSEVAQGPSPTHSPQNLSSSETPHWPSLTQLSESHSMSSQSTHWPSPSLLSQDFSMSSQTTQWPSPTQPSQERSESSQTSWPPLTQPSQDFAGHSQEASLSLTMQSSQENVSSESQSQWQPNWLLLPVTERSPSVPQTCGAIAQEAQSLEHDELRPAQLRQRDRSTIATQLSISCRAVGVRIGDSTQNLQLCSCLAQTRRLIQLGSERVAQALSAVSARSRTRNYTLQAWDALALVV